MIIVHGVMYNAEDVCVSETPSNWIGVRCKKIKNQDLITLIMALGLLDHSTIDIWNSAT